MGYTETHASYICCTAESAVSVYARVNIQQKEHHPTAVQQKRHESIVMNQQQTQSINNTSSVLISGSSSLSSNSSKQNDRNSSSGGSNSRSSGYHQKALEEIHNSLQPFVKQNSNDVVGSSAASTVSSISSISSSSASGLSCNGLSSTTSGIGSMSTSSAQQDRDQMNALKQSLNQLLSMGYSEDTSFRALKQGNGRFEDAIQYLVKQQNDVTTISGSNNGLSKTNLTKLIRKPSLERELSTGSGVPGGGNQSHRCSPASTTLDSGAGSSRSDSPRTTNSSQQPSDIYHVHTQLSRQYSPQSGAGNRGDRSDSEPPPPLPPPRCSSTPPPPPPPPHGVGGGVPSSQGSILVPTNMQQLLKRISPAAASHRPSTNVVTPPQGCGARGTSPVAVIAGNGNVVNSNGSSNGSGNGRQPMIVQNGPQVQQQLSQQIQALSLYQSGGGGGGVNQVVQQSSVVPGSEPPPPYPLPSLPPPPPPSYSISIQQRQSPTQTSSQQEIYSRKSPSSGIYSGPTSAGSPSPITVQQQQASPSTVLGSVVTRPTPLQAWGARQTKTQPPIIMQSVKSTQVQKPILQTAIAPTAPVVVVTTGGNGTPPVPPGVTTSFPPPSYASSIQQKHVVTTSPGPQSGVYGSKSNQTQNQTVTSSQQSINSSSTTTTPVNVPTTEPPSYASTMQALAAQRTTTNTNNHHVHHPHPLPPPPYTTTTANDLHRHPNYTKDERRKYSSPNNCDGGRSESPNTDNSRPNSGYSSENIPSSSSCSNSKHYNGNSSPNPNKYHPQQPASNNNNNLPPTYKKIQHQSPIPERKQMSKEKEDERRDCKVQNYSPQAYKFFMEQHIENVIKSHKQRVYRRLQLETEMAKIGLSAEAQCQMRKMLSQKESNYIRLKRAKMDKSMFTKIKPIGVGAFGEVTLVRKIDTNHLYAMKTLRKADVLKRNQVAHVKAERDILAEADNEWVVKLYYSFQDKDNLYFVMDYIPGGDLMSLLIKLGIFEESLARFYIAELTCAVESVHKMGFIHRDIKPDNILIDRDGHIKLTDFGLCTGFRWTHNSKYYQQNGEHGRQDSMDPRDEWLTDSSECRCFHQQHQLKPLERRRRREHQRCLAHSLVGTPNYIAPEVLQRTGYTQLCDWWSVGVILYEMLVGSPPFLANTPSETQYKVINWETTLHIPKQANLSRESMDLILKLCVGADKRLGKNANEVKSHAFFKNIDFDKGLRRQVAPHIPRIEYQTDTSNFDPVDPDKLRNSNDSNHSDNDRSDTSKPFHGFFEFTFRRFFDDGGGPAFTNKISLDDNDNQGPVYV